jgi:hypothetical protein
VRVTDSVGAPAVANLTLTILADVEPLRVLSSGDQATGQTGVDYSQQLFFIGGKPPVQWSIASGTLPAGLSLNSTTGIVSGKPTQVGIFTFQARVTDSEQQTATSNQLRIIITAGPLVVISNGAQPPGQTGVNYSLQLQGAGGVQPYTWSVAGGSLPPGLSLNTFSGAITGKPTEVGTFNFTVRIADPTTANVISGTLTIVITAGPLAITSVGDLTGGKVNFDYSHQLTFGGGRSPYTWALGAGSSLPPGLTLNAGTGLISGRPTQAGTFTFTVTLTDATPQTVSSGTLRIIVSP